MAQSNHRQVLIFDFDGLILDTESPEIVVWKKMFAEAGVVFDEEAYLKIVGTFHGNGYQPDQVLAASANHGHTAVQYASQATAAALEMINRQGVLPGVEKTIQAAKKAGAYLAVGSSSAHEWVDAHLKRLGLWREFDTVVCFEDVKDAKPAPDIFLKVLERLNVSPERAIVLEDSQNGVLAANRAGIRVVAVPNAVTCVQDFSGAIEVLPSLEAFDIHKYLQ